MTEFVVSAAAGSEIGNRYQANFDVAHLSLNPLVAVVADGMGDGQGSAMAGRTAVDIMVERVAAAENVGMAAIRNAVAAAQRQVGEFSRQIGGLAGCTLTALISSADGFWIANIGDSRLYRLRAGLLELLTADHTMAWLGAVHGWYPFDSPQAAAARYQLTRYIGHPGEPEPDIMNVVPLPGDVFLLCSDGVAEQVAYHQISEILGQQSEPEMMVRKILAAAEAAGGNDNATAIVVVIRR